MIAPAIIHLQSRDAAETRAVGERIGRLAAAGVIILLHGDLGAGKTTLTQGIASALGIVEPIQSPTFTLVAEHDGHDQSGNPLRLYHLDLYRLDDPADLESFGFDEYLTAPDGFAVIEWPERAGPLLPTSYLLVQLTAAGADTRHITIQAIPDAGLYTGWIERLGPAE
ncbi:MAG: tRNA (adenosine(37)-N6)-threonylcarbamoyltransferase complex ATPase subunit type 1 TsaE [Thermomicrobiales bacterium]